MTIRDGEDAAAAAARISRGPRPADIIARRDAVVGGGGPAGAAAGADSATDAPPYDPLRLCIYATIAALGWLLGPLALTVFAVIGFAGYWRAWRGGLKRSRCWLRDTRLVLLYLGVLAAAGAAGIVLFVVQLVS
ncbi:hypothetical protein JOD63_000945 [Microbacterium terrae]|uniref:Uncharacterized protein n=1 Tax=Microbacterium terrae TaxID=69369 RepID=A0A0M2HLV2_9MICO|nr:hypothetical protein [Microbacterium terrae]KJL45891.1 hypothetical protein RS81_00009 [Microbacterium terrae]MBP1076977.1 hypothetical protein [Microbacterium terrae]GLJ99571.1 hypothetical protein GCM10017594_27690 [Microbacterium terrae]